MFIRSLLFGFPISGVIVRIPSSKKTKQKKRKKEEKITFIREEEGGSRTKNNKKSVAGILGHVREKISRGTLVKAQGARARARHGVNS